MTDDGVAMERPDIDAIERRLAAALPSTDEPEREDETNAEWAGRMLQAARAAQDLEDLCAYIRHLEMQEEE